MLTEDEAESLYMEILEVLPEPLASDIEIGVRRGALRADVEVEASEPPSFRVRHDNGILISNRWALVVAVRTLLAAIDPIFQVSAAEKILLPSKEFSDVRKPMIVWAPDEPTTDARQKRAGGLGKAPKLEVPPSPSSREQVQIRLRVDKLVQILMDFENELLTAEDNGK